MKQKKRHDINYCRYCQRREMYLKNYKYLITLTPLDYVWLQIKLGCPSFIFHCWKDEEIFEGYRYRTYCYGILMIEIEEKI